jgi:hypothetical protein
MKSIQIYQAYGAVYDEVYATRADTIFMVNESMVRVAHDGDEATIRLGANQMAIIKEYKEGVE